MNRTARAQPPGSVLFSVLFLLGIVIVLVVAILPQLGVSRRPPKLRTQ